MYADYIAACAAVISALEDMLETFAPLPDANAWEKATTKKAPMATVNFIKHLRGKILQYRNLQKVIVSFCFIAIFFLSVRR